MTPRPSLGCALGAMLLATAAARAEINHLPFSNAASPSHSIAHAAFEAEAKASIDPAKITISEIDLNGDGTAEIFAYAETPMFCDADGCEPALFSKEGDAWRNILVKGTARTRAIPGDFSITTNRHAGYFDFMIGSLYIVHDGTSYREYVPPPPTQLDEGAFFGACTSSQEVALEVRAAGPRGDIEEPVDVFCLCLFDQFQNASLPQADLDLFSDMLAGRKSVKEAGPMSSIPDEYAAKVADFRFSCEIDLRVD